MRIEVYFNAAAVPEPRDILDSLGKPLTAARHLTARFYRPGADSLTIRVTRGLRTVLNRNYTAGTAVAPDMFLRTVERRVFDTTHTPGTTASYGTVLYPVAGEIDFKRAPSGRLEVGLELYLYPLETGR